MKNKKIIFTIIPILVLIGLYFGIKGFYLLHYKTDSITTESYNSIKEGLAIKDTITVKKSDDLNNDYLTFKNIKIKNDFKNYKKLDNQASNDDVKYALYDEENNIVASFWMGTTTSYVDMFNNNITLFGIEDKRILNGNISEILEKNNITSDIDLFKYLENHKNAKNNIFTSIKKMKEDYILQFMISTAFPITDGITIISGDHQGFMFNIKNPNSDNSNIFEARINNNKKVYYFTFINNKNNYFTKEYISNILGTLIIN